MSNKKTKQKNKNTLYTQFIQFGNLAFFPNNFEAKNRFFFFKTLLSDYERNGNPEYTARANAIGQQAINDLSNSPFGFEKEESTRFLEIMDQTVKILKQGINSERQNELKYVQNKINQFYRNTPKEMLKNNPDAIAIEAILKKLYLDKNKTTIDYISLINLINVLRQGAENTKAIFEKEQEQFKKINEQYNKSKQSYFNQIGGLDKSGKLKHKKSDQFFEKRFDNNAAKIYLENKTFNLGNGGNLNRFEQYLNAHMQGIQTVDVQIAAKMTNLLQDFFNSPQCINILETEIKNQLIITQMDLDKIDTKNFIKSNIIKAVVSYFNQNISKVLNTDIIDKKNMVEDIASYIQNNGIESFDFKIEGMYPNFGQLGKHLSYFEKSHNNSEDLFDAVNELYYSVGRVKNGKKQQVQDLTEDQKITRRALGLHSQQSDLGKIIKLIHKLETILKTKKKLDSEEEEIETILLNAKKDVENQEKIPLKIINKNGELTIEGDFLKTSAIGDYLNFKQFNPQNLQNAIRMLKSRASQKIKETLDALITNDIIQKKLGQPTEKTLKNGLENLRISIGGPKQNEIAVQMQNAINEHGLWSGPINLKTDNIIITMYDEGVTNNLHVGIPTDFTRAISREVIKKKQELEDEFSKEYITAIEKDMENFNKKKKYNQFSNYAKQFFEQQKIKTGKITEVQEKIKNITQDLQEIADESEFSKKEQELNSMNSFLNSLENSLYISSTSKTYNNYMNNLGFIGGSIGSNIINQIDHLNEIFSAAGMGLTKDEIDWLIFAAINNSSLSVIGHKNENKLEAILGSLATFALFDEGAAEVEILRNQIDTTLESKPSSDIMHLYYVNGMYYPGSFVLTQALENIEAILKDIENATNTREHNNVKIVSTVSFKDLPNSIYDYQQKRLNTHPWQTVSKIAESKTNIHILFLAGLMGVVNSLLSRFNEIELPTT